jgi:hypothetical protein
MDASVAYIEVGIWWQLKICDFQMQAFVHIVGLHSLQSFIV